MQQSSVADRLTLALLTVFVSSCASLVYDSPISCESCTSWNQPQEPFRIFGDAWYVGVGGLSAVLIDTGEGLVLLDGGLPQSAPLINTSIRALGFRAEDIEFILVSHVHYDHIGGIAALQRLSGATVLTSGKGERPLLRGQLDADDPQYDPQSAKNRFPPIANVRAVKDQERIAIGNVTITGHYTPGHTPGGMTWTWKSCSDRDCKQIVYADSLNPIATDGFRFGAAPRNVADDLRASIARIGSMDCDILLSNHPFFFDMQQKLQSVAEDRFVNRDACRNYADAANARLERRLAREVLQ